MTDTHDEYSDFHSESVLAGNIPTWLLPPPRVPAPPPVGGHLLRWAPTDPETLARVCAALRRL